MTKYTVTAGDVSTDLGVMGRCASLREARRVGRRAVDACLPGGSGTYVIRDADGKEVERGERTMRTGYAWMARS